MRIWVYDYDPATRNIGNERSLVMILRAAGRMVPRSMRKATFGTVAIVERALLRAEDLQL
jgi:hypothetical protein